MANSSCAVAACPVNDAVTRLDGILASGRIAHPRSRRIAEEILELLNDIAWGRGGPDHIPAIETLAETLSQNDDVQATEAGRRIQTDLAQHREVFASHVDTHNCAAGTCVKLAPAPCQMACPAGIDVPTYVTLIGMGKDAEAIEVIRRDNPFPWVCGLICTRPCEYMCVRGRIDTPVSIKFLKAFAAERAMSEGNYLNPPKESDKEKKVCVIGAGPGGMSCAYYLALKGYSVRVIEALPSAGGMIFVGIPRYRLPREVIDREVAMIEELGVEFQFNARFGRDVTFTTLQAEGFEAFFFAIGAHAAYKLNIPGETDYQVTDAIDLLQRVALGERRKPGRRVIVIGGGNVAIDAARTCLRLGCEEVTIAYRRTRNEMPADVEEVEQAEEEGILFSFLTVPIAVEGRAGKPTGLRCLRAKLVARDGSTRMSPVPVEGSDFVMPADVVIGAIGQRVDQACMKDLPDMKWTRRSTIDVNMVSMETSIPGVFAAGDAVTGPATVIEAIGGGKRAAVAIDRYLSGIPQPKMPPVPVRRSRVDYLEVPSTTKMILKRPEMPLIALDRRRTTFQQVELGYPENAVREEARRCLRCDICRRCGECVEICRDKMKVDALQMGYFDFDHPVETDFRLTQERCILCGACANNCPNQAMQMKDVNGERVLSLCGTVLNRKKILACEQCGAVMGTRKYIEYIRRRINPVGRIVDERLICDACLRKNMAAANVDIFSATKGGIR
ncbi:FAD-dependent oxidoreductase [Desulfococcus sp.]|uniref:FAD-dependent oxidoreductase n=1 Tax=Desulfococcus sp. TaxID=2025834 RepID=UPI00359485D6